ncbi:MAG TPA: hypothetical protein VIK01_08760 [Polyangiaceae bacterium]
MGRRHRRSELIWLLPACLLGCATAHPVTHGSVPSHAVRPPPTGRVLTKAAGEVASVAQPARVDAGVGEPSPTAVSDAKPGRRALAPVPDVAVWLAAHEAFARLTEHTCSAVDLGVPLAPGLLCIHEGPAGNSARLYRIEHHRLVLVWAHVVAKGWVTLFLEVGPDGSEIFWRDERGCEGAFCEAYAKYEQHAHGYDMVASVVTTCAARGRYVWRNGRYVRDRHDTPPPLTPEALKPDLDGSCLDGPDGPRPRRALTLPDRPGPADAPP